MSHMSWWVSKGVKPWVLRGQLQEGQGRTAHST